MGGGLTSSQCRKKIRREDGGGGHREKTSLLIRFPGYDDQECHPSLISGFRKGSQRRKEERRFQRTPCEEMLNGG